MEGVRQYAGREQNAPVRQCVPHNTIYNEETPEKMGGLSKLYGKTYSGVQTSDTAANGVTHGRSTDRLWRFRSQYSWIYPIYQAKNKKCEKMCGNLLSNGSGCFILL